MKTLYIIRHAKSSWDDSRLADFDRPLNKRGLRDAPFMAAKMAEELKEPEIIISSPAKRALATAKTFREGFSRKKIKLKTDKRLYHPTIFDILSVVHGIDEKRKVAAIFGHNPGFTTFVNEIADAEILNIPTTGVVVLRCEAKYWANFEDSKVKVRGFYYPKKYR